jgi:hypothetical protein
MNPPARRTRQLPSQGGSKHQRATEAYHQNFLTLHPESPYIATFDLPKIAALQKVFPTEFRSDPVLVPGRSS